MITNSVRSYANFNNQANSRVAFGGGKFELTDQWHEKGKNGFVAATRKMDPLEMKELGKTFLQMKTEFANDSTVNEDDILRVNFKRGSHYSDHDGTYYNGSEFDRNLTEPDKYEKYQKEKGTEIEVSFTPGVDKQNQGVQASSVTVWRPDNKPENWDFNAEVKARIETWHGDLKKIFEKPLQIASNIHQAFYDLFSLGKPVDLDNIQVANTEVPAATAAAATIKTDAKDSASQEPAHAANDEIENKAKDEKIA